MTDPLTLGLASTAVGLLNGTINLVKEARESAKRSDDHDLKDKLSEVFDSVLALKEVMSDLRDENADLKKKLETRASLRWNTEIKLYFAEADPDPFCPACYDLNARQVRLMPYEYNHGVLSRYDCKICKNFFSARPR